MDNEPIRTEPADTTRRSTAPGPEPEDAPGLEPGGSVPPGDTPPDAGQTSGLSHPQPMPSRTPAVVTLVIVAVLVLGTAAFFVLRGLDLL
ncbi:hypothetical protein GCM10027258_67190 [Amycolatopsis stemonae]